MITPRFKLSQEDNFLTIQIRAPYSSLRELDVDVSENVFLFLCKPYYLRLNLPGEVVDDNRVKSSFDIDSGEFSFTYPKKTPGENFKDLDLIMKLLVPKIEGKCKDGSISIPVEVLSESQTEELDSEKLLNEETLEYGFGFALRAHKDFVRISSKFDDVFEIDPTEVPLQERRKLRIQYEQGKFNVDHYLADFIEDSEICEIIAQPCPFENAKQNPNFNYTDKDLDFMKDLSNIQYQLYGDRVTYCFNGLIDILFAYCYDQRISFFEGGSESGWNITKLASTLSWLDVYIDPKDVLVSAFRRSMIYPFFRHFDLAQTVFKDLKVLIQLGEKYIIKVLLVIYNIFLHGDCNRYILNNLFIRDYIIYVTNWNNDLWVATVNNILSIEIKKEDLGLNLSEIEDEFKLQDKLASLQLDESDSDDSNCSSDDSSDDSSSSGDSETDSDDSIEPTDAAGAIFS